MTLNSDPTALDHDFLHSLVYALPFPFTGQHPSYGDCPEVKREYYQN